MPPVLAASTLRIDVAGVPAIDDLSLETTGGRVLVLGAARALFEAAAGLRPIARGLLLVEGTAPLSGVRAGHVACAPLDPPLPPRWTVAQYTQWSARTAGHSRSAAKELCAQAIGLMGLESMTEAKLGAATLPTRRGAVLAAALATDARTLVIDDPLAGLGDEAVRPLARLLALALVGRRSVLFAGRIPLESPLALGADEAVIIHGFRAVAQGTPTDLAAAERTLSLRVQGDVAAFARAVEAEGGQAAITAGTPQPVHVRVELGPLAPPDLLRIASAASAVVFELRPLARSFA